MALGAPATLSPVREPLSAAWFHADGVGVTSSDCALFPFDKVERPVYPLNPDMAI